MILKKYQLSFFFIIIIFSYAKGQLSVIDSLRNELINSKHDTTRCQLYFALGDYFQLSNLDSAIYYFQKYHKLAEAQGLQKDQANALRLIGISYGKQGIFNEALDWLNRALSLNLKIGNSIEAAKCYSNIGIIHHEKGSYSLALEYFHKSLDISETIGDKRRISYMYNNIGNLHESQRSYDLALEYFQKSLQVKKDLGDTRGMSASYHNIGVIQRKKGEYDLAINNYRESLRICEELDDNIGMSNTYSSLASIFIDKGELDAANEHYQKALRLSETFGEKHTTSRILGNIAMLHRRMGNLAEVPIEREKQYHLALKYAERGLEIAQEIDALPMISFHYNTISNIWEGMGNNAKALAYSRLFDQTRDSLFNEEKTRAITEMQTRYETEKIQQEIENQKLVIESQELKNKQQRTRQNLLAIITLFILFIAISSVFGFITIKKKNHKLFVSETKLKQTVQTKDKLFSIIAHDLRNPMMASESMIDALHEHFEKMTDQQKVEIIQSIQKATHQTSELIENLLMWSLSQTDRINFNPDCLDLMDITISTIQQLSGQIKQKDIIVKNHIPDKTFIHADRNMVMLIIRNLLSNAIKFSKERSDIFILSEDLGNNIKVTLKDHGWGMSEELKKTLFSTYSVKAQEKTEGRATGLGLILCKEFVEKNGGNIFIESEQGKGTSVIFTLKKCDHDGKDKGLPS